MENMCCERCGVSIDGAHWELSAHRSDAINVENRVVCPDCVESQKTWWAAPREIATHRGSKAPEAREEFDAGLASTFMKAIGLLRPVPLEVVNEQHIRRDP